MSGRRDYLLAVTERMWPSPTFGRPRRTPGERCYLLVPSAAEPRLMLPAGTPRVAAAAVRGFTGDRVGLARLRSAVTASAVRTGIVDALLRERVVVARPGGIDAHLSDVLGEPVVVGMAIGPDRANRKPVLSLLSPAGRLLGFAKIGTDELTRGLLAAEAAALTTLAGRLLPGIGVPRLLHHAGWRDLDVLVQSALDVRGGRAPDDAQRQAAMVTLARSGDGGDGGGPPTGPVAASPYVAGLRAELAALGSPGERLAADVGSLVAHHPERPLAIGAWHGDWTPWNGTVSAADGRVLLWDWERFDPAVPLGYDALHHRLQRRTEGRAPVGADVVDLVDAAPGELAGFGVPVADAPGHAILYLAELARRYLRDGQQHAGGPRGRVAEWLLPALHDRVLRLTEGS